MADQTELRMNLAAIKRVDPYAKDIVDSSAHVAFYTFNSDENEWEKTDVEGAFFIYSRNAEPFHSIFINNRLNTNSFVEPVTGQLELQSQPPFLLYRNERSRIRGFWFYNSSECDRIGELVGNLIKECESKVTVTSKQEILRTGKNIDIFTMLSKAQQDFNNAKSNTSSSKCEYRSQLDVTSQSVMNFFAAVKPAAASEVPLFKRLLSNPVSVDQIEKQQRVTTPLDGKNSPTILQLNDLGASPLAKFINSNANVDNSRTNCMLTNVQNADKDTILHQKPLQQILLRENSLTVQSTSKPALMPPTMFLSTSTNEALLSKETTSLPKKQPSSLQLQQQLSVVANRNNQEVNQLTFETSDTMNISKPEPLTQTQLLQAMLYLIKHDSDFIKKLHEAYLKSFTDMVSS